MKDEEILKKAIEKAVKNGFKWQYDWVTEWELRYSPTREEYVVYLLSRAKFLALSINDIVFNKDFAKAFWGELDKDEVKRIEDDYKYWSSTEEEPIEVRQQAKQSLEKLVRYPHPWQFHLQQMVLEENPISYLAKFL